MPNPWLTVEYSSTDAVAIKAQLCAADVPANLSTFSSLFYMKFRNSAVRFPEFILSLLWYKYENQAFYQVQDVSLCQLRDKIYASYWGISLVVHV